jgi:hypothetical protein
MFAAFYRAPEHIAGLAVAIQAEQPENGTGTATHKVQLFVRDNEIVGE